MGAHWLGPCSHTRRKAFRNRTSDTQRGGSTIPQASDPINGGPDLSKTLTNHDRAGDRYLYWVAVFEDTKGYDIADMHRVRWTLCIPQAGTPPAHTAHGLPASPPTTATKWPHNAQRSSHPHRIHLEPRSGYTYPPTTCGGTMHRATWWCGPQGPVNRNQVCSNEKTHGAYHCVAPPRTSAR